MAIGDIGNSVLGSLDVTCLGHYPSVVHLDGDYVAIVGNDYDFEDPDNCWIKTYSITDSGATITAIDSWNFTSGSTGDTEYPYITKIPGTTDKYIISYYREAPYYDGTVFTLTISTTGEINKNKIDTFLDVNFRTWTKVFHTGNVNDICFGVGYYGNLDSFTVDSDGIIGDSIIDNHDYTTLHYASDIINLDDNYYAFTQDEYIHTFSTDGSGNITAIESWDAGVHDIFDIKKIGTSTKYIISYQDGNDDNAKVSSLTISDIGEISGSFTDTLDISPDGFRPCLTHVGDDYFIVNFRDESNTYDSLEIVALTCNSDGEISNSITDSLTVIEGVSPFDRVRYSWQNGVVRVSFNTYCIAAPYSSGIDGKLVSFKIESEPETVAETFDSDANICIEETKTFNSNSILWTEAIFNSDAILWDEETKAFDSNSILWAKAIFDSDSILWDEETGTFNSISILWDGETELFKLTSSAGLFNWADDPPPDTTDYPLDVTYPDPDNLIDGDYDTSWGTYCTKYHSYGLDLGSAKTVSHFKFWDVTGGTNDLTGGNVIIMGGSNNNDWTQVGDAITYNTGGMSRFNSEVTTIELTDKTQSYRYWRIYFSWYLARHGAALTFSEMEAFIEISSRDFNSDSILWDEETKIFNSNSILWDEETKTFDSNTIICIEETGTFDSNSITYNEKTETFDSDSILWTEETKTFDSDSILWTEAIFDSNSILWDEKTSLFNSDSILWDEETKAFDSNSILWDEETKTFDSDSITYIDKTSTFDSNSITYNEKTSLFNSDSILWDEETKTFDSDAITYIDKTFTFDSNSIICIEETKTFDSDSILWDEETKTFDSNSILWTEETGTFDSDAITCIEETKTFDSDSILWTEETKTFDSNSILWDEETKTFDSNSILWAETIFDSNSILWDEETKTFDSDAITYIDKTFTFDSNAIVYNEKTETFDSDAITYIDKTSIFNSNSILWDEETKTFDSDSILWTEETKTFDSDAITYIDKTSTFSSDSYLYASALVISDARIIARADIENEYTVPRRIQPNMRNLGTFKQSGGQDDGNFRVL